MAPKNSTKIVFDSSAKDISIISKVGPVENEEKVTILDFFEGMSDLAYFDTGLLPCSGTGMLMMRKAMNRMQIVFQYEPNIYAIAWTAYQGGQPTVYHLAQPYRIVVIDFIDGNLHGGKQFYSPTAIAKLEQPLYHTNVPNTNCRGYGGNNAVGWTCIYRNKDISKWTMRSKIDYVLKRISGEETYNDGNMGSTDGTRFYKSHNKPKFLWDPVEWQKKSLNEGFKWTQNQDLWLPILVEGPDLQHKHVDGGKPLTLQWAVYGHYSCYYDDTYNGRRGGYGAEAGIKQEDKAYRKPFNLLDRTDGDTDKVTTELFQALKKAINNPPKHHKVAISADNQEVMDFVGGDIVIKSIYSKTCSICKVKHSTTDDDAVDDDKKLYWIDGDFAQAKTITVKDVGGKPVCATCEAKMYVCSVCSAPQVGNKNAMPKFHPETQLLTAELDNDNPVCDGCSKTINKAVTACGKCNRGWINPKGYYPPAKTTQGQYYANVQQYTPTKTTVDTNGILEAWKTKVGIQGNELDFDQHVVEVEGQLVCDKCSQVEHCDFCAKVTLDIYPIDAKKLELVEYKQEHMKLCVNCFTTHVVCACKKLASVDFMVKLGDDSNVCGGCTSTDPSGHLVYDPDGQFSEVEVVLDMSGFSLPDNQDPNILAPIDPNAVLEMP
jgi:hypothetical protein